MAPEGGPERARALYDLGDALVWSGQVRDAETTFEEAAEAASVTGDPSLERLARIRRFATRFMTDPHGASTQQARAELEEAARIFEELGDEAALAVVWSELAQIEWMPCRYERAEVAARRAIEHARRSGDERLLTAPMALLLGAQMLGTTKPEQGVATLDDLAPDLARSRQMEAFALVFRGYHRGMQGAFADARRMYGEAITVSGSLGLRFDLAAHNEELGHLEYYAGDAVASERAFRKNYTILDEAGDEGHKSTSAASLALALCDLDRYAEAEPYAEEALRIGAEDDLATQSPGRSARARVLSARGEFDEAERLAREAVELFADAETPNFQGDAWMHLAKVLREAGKPDEAGQAAREALALYERKGNEPGAALAQAFVDEL